MPRAPDRVAPWDTERNQCRDNRGVRTVLSHAGICTRISFSMRTDGGPAGASHVGAPCGTCVSRSSGRAFRLPGRPGGYYLPIHVDIGPVGCITSERWKYSEQADHGYWGVVCSGTCHQVTDRPRQGNARQKPRHFRAAAVRTGSASFESRLSCAIHSMASASDAKPAAVSRSAPDLRISTSKVSSPRRTVR